MSCLFICATPLQCIIAKRIIEKNKLVKSECLLFSYSREKNLKLDYYFKKLATRCVETKFYLREKPFPLYLLEARKYFKSLKYDAIYFANIDSIFPLTAMSVNPQAAVYTFDDGTGNLVSTGNLSEEYEFPAYARLAYYLFGNRYSVRSARSRVDLHYTIYPLLENNISKNLVPLQLTPPMKPCPLDRSCSVILGAVIGDLFAPRNTASVIGQLINFSRSIEGEIFYIPHPRGERIDDFSQLTIDSNLAAEDIIVDLYARYNNINLYGFCNSTQMIFSKTKGIHNFFLFASGGKPSMQALHRLAKKHSTSITDIIDLNRD